MATVFDSEQWTITRLYDPATYAGMDNVIEVVRLSGEKRSIYVAVPTELFKYIKGVMHVENTRYIQLYLDEAEDGSYVFGIENTAFNHHHDLWPYKVLPKWAIDRDN